MNSFFRVLSLVFIYTILIVMAVFCLYPILWIVASSFTTGNYVPHSLLPDGFNLNHFNQFFSLEHFRHLFNETDYLKWYKNTLKIAFWNMILSTLLVVTAGYAFSRYRFPGRKQGLMTMLVLQMFPSFMGMVAIFVLLDRIGLLDNHWGLILVYAGGSIPFNAWLVKGYFDGIPKSLEEAAKIDGAGHATTFFKIMMPLSRPILVFVAVSNFIGPWMDFIFARLVLTSTDKMTLAIGLYDMINGKTATEFTNFAAGAVLVAVPITVLYIAFQKYLVEGITSGANKG